MKIFISLSISFFLAPFVLFAQTSGGPVWQFTYFDTNNNVSVTSSPYPTQQACVQQQSFFSTIPALTNVTACQQVGGTSGSGGGTSVNQTFNQISYSLLAPIGSLTGAPTLSAYLIRLVELAIGIAGVLAVIMIVKCGFDLLTSPGAGKREEAKHCLVQAVLGLLLILSGYLILQTISPNLNSASFNIPSLQGGQPGGGASGTTTPGGGATCPTGATCEWRNDSTPCAQAPQCQQRLNQTRAVGQASACAGAQPGGTVCCIYTPAVCSNCITITAPTSNSSQAEQSLAGALNSAWATWSGLPWRVTEAVPNTVPHCSNAEVLGQSVDVAFNITAGTSITSLSPGQIAQLASSINQFTQAMQSRGRTVVFEVRTAAEQSALVSAGVSGTIQVFSFISGAHFSVY